MLSNIATNYEKCFVPRVFIRLEQENAQQRQELEALRASAAREARFRFRGCNHPVRTSLSR
jgi:hypothetical protein